MPIRIKSLSELQKHIDQPAAYQLYRGESELFKKPITCGLVRELSDINKIRRYEIQLFNEFIKLKDGNNPKIQTPYVNKENYKFQNEWYWLFQAQHLQLKTRLIDFTSDWKVALLFAVNEWEKDNEDASFFIFHISNEDKITTSTEYKLYNQHPNEIKDSFMINPTQYQSDEFDFIGKRRMMRQSGWFWVQSLENSIISLNNQKKYNQLFTQIIIDKSSKKSIREELAQYSYLVDWIYYKYDYEIESCINEINNKYFPKATNTSEYGK